MFNLPKFFKKTFGLSLVFISSFIFFSQIFFPELTAASMQGYVTPVAANYFEELACKRLNSFLFEELSVGGAAPLEDDIKIPAVFYLSIPKLGIEKALVETNSVKIRTDESLGHVAGTSLPIDIGNTFMYGHSTLPALYNPADYKAIFTYLYTLSKGDEVIIEYNDVSLKFLVQGKQVISPQEVSPLALKHLNYSSLTLMTCTPPGRVDRRLLVFAKKVY